MTLQNESMHDILIRDDTYKGTRQDDYSTSSRDGNTRVLFKDLEPHLIEYIRHSDVVVGCVAWLTSEPILRALAEINSVSIIVQKEDFLRPDIMSFGRVLWAQRLRMFYDQLPSLLCRYDLGGVLSGMNVAGDMSIEPIRCVGNYNAEKHPAFPRSHHKFIVFCRIVESPAEGFWIVTPTHVWTGSYNFTKNAGMSFENAIVLRDPEIVKAYYHEYLQIAALSEPLDWESEWCAPEWRIGT